MSPQDLRCNQGHWLLKNPRLRKIRYKLRSMLLALFELKEVELLQKIGQVSRDKSLSHDKRTEMRRHLRKEREDLILSFSQRPINCAMCGDREEDLIYQQDDNMWVCHNREGCHQRVEQYAQKVRKMLKERIDN